MSATGEEEASTSRQEGKQAQPAGNRRSYRRRRNKRKIESHEFLITYLYDASSGSYVTGRRFTHTENKPRLLPDLKTSATDPADAIATELCDKLFEAKTFLILRIVEELGAEKAMRLFKETQKLEKAGGLLVRNCSRRRTSGGIYIYLFTHDPSIPQEQRKAILKEDRENYLRKIMDLKEKTRIRIEELLQPDPKDTEERPPSPAEEVNQPEQRTSSPSPEPETDASDYSSCTDSDGQEDNPWDRAGAPGGYRPGDRGAGGASGRTSPLEKHCAKCTMEKNRRAQVAFIKMLFEEE